MMNRCLLCAFFVALSMAFIGCSTNPATDATGWTTSISTNGKVQINHPAAWKKQLQMGNRIELAGFEQGFSLYWRDSLNGGHEIADAIAASETEPNFGQTYSDFVRETLHGYEKGGGEILSISEPRITHIGSYDILVTDVLLSPPSTYKPPVDRLLFKLYDFDCGTYYCRASTYGETLSPNMIESAERVLASIRFNN